MRAFEIIPRTVLFRAWRRITRELGWQVFELSNSAAATTTTTTTSTAGRVMIMVTLMGLFPGTACFGGRDCGCWGRDTFLGLEIFAILQTRGRWGKGRITHITTVPFAVASEQMHPVGLIPKWCIGTGGIGCGGETGSVGNISLGRAGWSSGTGWWCFEWNIWSTIQITLLLLLLLMMIAMQIATILGIFVPTIIPFSFNNSPFSFFYSSLPFCQLLFPDRQIFISSLDISLILDQLLFLFFQGSHSVEMRQ